MPIFAGLYQRVMRWSTHRHAPALMAGLSFAESTFFPVPPDVMLAPMALARPERGLWLAALCTAASVLGGAVGYLIGYLAFDLVEPLLHRGGYWNAYMTAREFFERYGLWCIILAGFSPIPYKVFTIAGGVIGMPFAPFMLGSLIGRGGRFFLVAGLIVLGGVRMEQALRRNVEILGWSAVAVAVIAVVVVRLW